MEDDKQFEIKLEHIDKNNFMVTMIRQTTPKKKFVIYFKLEGDNVYFSTTDSIFLADDQNKFLTFNLKRNECNCLRELILQNQLLTSEIYTFPLCDMNRDVFKAFPFYMNSILRSISDSVRNQQAAQQQKERDEKIEKIITSSDYLKFYKDITDKVRDKKQQLDESTTYNPNDKQILKKQLDDSKSKIISEQLSAMNMEEKQPTMAAGIYSNVQRLIRENIDNFVTNVKPASSSEHYGVNDGPTLSTPKQNRTIIRQDERGEDVYESSPAAHNASGYGYGSSNTRDDMILL